MRFLLIIISLSALGFGQPGHAESGGQRQAVGFHGPHHLSMLFADTHIRSHGDYATLGIDYEYRVSQLLGLGVVLEQAYEGLNATTALAVADVHLHRGLIMQLGPGFEWMQHERIAVVRVGMLYEFEFGQFTLSPQLHWDFHDGHDNAVVAGLALGFAF